MDKLKLAAPWVTYYNKLNALFGKDPDIKLDFDNDVPEVKLYVEGDKKADALMRLLPTMVSFGNVSLKVTVVPANPDLGISRANLIKDAFEGNPVYAWDIDLSLPLSTQTIRYVMFKNEVVQFYNDQLDDPNGNLTTLYQDIAKELIGESDGVHFCTDDPTKPHPYSDGDCECDSYWSTCDQ
jgi:hypothetical protein